MAAMNNDERSVLAVGGFGLGVVALAFAGFAISRSGDSGSNGGVTAAVTTTAVDVNLTEFAMTPNMLDVPPGDVTIRVTNSGNVAHNFSIPERNLTTRDLQPGEAQTITLKNATTGELPFLCTIPGQSASGMTGMAHVSADNSATTTPAPPTTMSY